MTTSPTSHNTGSCALRDVHEHGWTIESSHSTSEGRVLYVRCAECGIRRVDLQRRPEAPPEPLTRSVSETDPEQSRGGEARQQREDRSRA